MGKDGKEEKRQRDTRLWDHVLLVNPKVYMQELRQDAANVKL